MIRFSTFILETALQASQESGTFDFKEAMDVESKGDWLELIKDIVAMANSGGGVILVGLFDNGNPSGFDVAPILNVDPADLTNRIFSYTGQHFSEFRISAIQKGGTRIAVVEVGSVPIPIVFNKVGNYQGQNGKPKIAFQLGSVYFRHGAKSEPCTSDDLKSFLHREIEAVKQSWLGGIRKVVEAPENSQFLVIPPDTQTDFGQGFRPTDNPNAPEVRLNEAAALDMYPLTYRELTDELSRRYKNFVENRRYHELRKSLLANPRYARERFLNPRNPQSSKTCFYSRAILGEFDKHYKK
jgi:hypothetical protein